ncbi:MarR family winged helix-turn-helix transcriptional regulator [Cohnella kolymensis]|uniref:MarR family winged helix-turn-helix transcriptional regulator n=1 Tax=Cohnella kolymensis TaxID=1590652 RepID=UPI0006965D64|nr:MarR family transcriptional regulator [Cohnella kolymensis]
MNHDVLGELAYAIIKLSGVFGADKSFVEGLTPKQLHLLMEIGSRTYRHGDLASILGVDPSTLTRTLDPLVKADLVDRKSNPDNRREVLIRLSEKGLSVIEVAHEKHKQLFERILSQVPKSQQKQVEESVGILLKIIKHTEIKH